MHYLISLESCKDDLPYEMDMPDQPQLQQPSTINKYVIVPTGSVVSTGSVIVPMVVLLITVVLYFLLGSVIVPYCYVVTNLNFTSNTIPNPRNEVKVITTRSGLAYDGTLPPMPPPYVNSDNEKAKETKVTKDKVQPESSQSTANVQPRVDHRKGKDKLKDDEVFLPKSPLIKPNKPTKTLPYPFRVEYEKKGEKDKVQIQKFWEIKKIHVNIELCDAFDLILSAISHIFPNNNLEDSFKMGNEDLNLIPNKELDKEDLIQSKRVQNGKECDYSSFDGLFKLRYLTNSPEIFKDFTESGDSTSIISDPPSFTPFEGSEMILEEEIEEFLKHDESLNMDLNDEFNDEEGDEEGVVAITHKPLAAYGVANVRTPLSDESEYPIRRKA
ncbi:hypothetical protein Tco_0470657 [Tanacetum coccineum]